MIWSFEFTQDPVTFRFFHFFLATLYLAKCIHKVWINMKFDNSQLTTQMCLCYYVKNRKCCQEIGAARFIFLPDRDICRLMCMGMTL